MRWIEEEKGTVYINRFVNPNTKRILHSGAGRISTIRMSPMSLFESKDYSGQDSLQSLFDGIQEYFEIGL